MPDLLPPTPREFVHALRKRWIVAMAGGIGVSAWLVSVFFPKIGATTIVQVAALAAVVLAAYGIWAQERSDYVRLDRRMQEFADLQIAPDGFYEEARTFQLTYGLVGSTSARSNLSTSTDRPNELTASMLHLRIINEVHGIPSEHSRAEVVARIHFIDSTNRERFFMDGRWADSTQPSRLQPHQAAMELLPVTFLPGQIHELDIACKFYSDEVAYGFNNDSYYRSPRDERWMLPTGAYIARVHVTGTHVNKEWDFPFHVGGVNEGLRPV